MAVEICSGAWRLDSGGTSRLSRSPYKTTDEGQYKEQKEMDARGGKDKLDNKRNEVSPERMKELEKKYGPHKPKPRVKKSFHSDNSTPGTLHEQGGPE
jgi:hypothetical protein